MEGYPSMISENIAAHLQAFSRGDPVLLADHRQLHSFENFLAVTLLPLQYKPREEEVKNTIFRDFHCRTSTISHMGGNLALSFLSITVAKFEGSPKEFQTEYSLVDRGSSTNNQLSDNCIDFTVTAVAHTVGYTGQIIAPSRIRRITDTRYVSMHKIAWRHILGTMEGLEGFKQAQRNSAKRAGGSITISDGGRQTAHRIERSFGGPRD